MRLTRVIVMVLFLPVLLCSQQRDAVKPRTPTTLLGITLGKPLDDAVPEGPGGEAIMVDTESRCCFFTGDNPDGPVTRFSVTVPEPFCTDGLAQVRRKLGPPSRSEINAMQNAMGAHWKGYVYLWRRNGGDEVTFWVHYEFQNCSLEATTKAYRDDPKNKPAGQVEY